MFKRRRLSTASTATDLPFCAMCGQAVRVDPAAGRCALGHRVAVAAARFAVETVESATHSVSETTTPAQDGDDAIAAFTAARGYDPYASLDATAAAAGWDTATDDTRPIAGLDEFLSWEDEAPQGSSALDVDTAELVSVPQPQEPVTTATTVTSTVSSDLLDELDDAAHARRRAVGTLGATLAITAFAVASIAALPL